MYKIRTHRLSKKNNTVNFSNRSEKYKHRRTLTQIGKFHHKDFNLSVVSTVIIFSCLVYLVHNIEIVMCLTKQSPFQNCRKRTNKLKWCPLVSHHIITKFHQNFLRKEVYYKETKNSPFFENTISRVFH
jgi:hypothetical protein